MRKSRFLSIVVAAILAAGCEGMTPTQRGAVTGGALGTGIGMVAGGSFGQVVGAGLIGGAAGASSALPQAIGRGTVMLARPSSRSPRIEAATRYAAIGIIDMREAEPSDRSFIAGIFRSHWLLFILVGALLFIAGLVACTVPAVSSIAPNELLGLVLAFVGIVQIAQSGKMQGEVLFAWHLTLGLLAALGGVLVYLDPFPGIVTITALMAMVFALHGLTQIAFALKVRQLKGWHWFVASGCIALIVAGLLMMKLPYDHTLTPASVGGVSLMFAGWAYVAVALASRKVSRP